VAQDNPSLYDKRAGDSRFTLRFSFTQTGAYPSKNRNAGLIPGDLGDNQLLAPYIPAFPNTIRIKLSWGKSGRRQGGLDYRPNQDT
jgi:hypothetical protein